MQPTTIIPQQKVSETNPLIQEKTIRNGLSYHDDFTNLKIIVTGASKGIGRIIAMNLLEAGAQVALVARTKLELEKIAQRYPMKATVYAYDLSDPMQINVCFKKIIEHFKCELDLVFHCAGKYQNQKLDDLTMREWDESQNINCRAMVHLTGLAVPFIEQSAAPNKSIVVLTADNNAAPISGEVSFSVAKAMANMFIQCMALELAEKKIRINGVAPTVVETAFRVGDLKKGITTVQNQTYIDTYATVKPLKSESKLPDAINVADIALWLASNEANFITGEVIKIDDAFSLSSLIPKPKP
mmetsp:Transcript_46454/g.53858  ORF Transcript_46454/g.53858 Transcript_46454/m.53858 type:complete len:299 (+) Transcript_46454:65-961(+)